MSIYRNSIWFLKGLREYTKGGYVKAAKNFDPTDIEVDASKRNFMVTGANSGIGRSTALELAKRGGTVHLVCRSAERGKEAQEAIIKETKNDKVHLHLVDMSQPKEILKFTTQFVESGAPLDTLVNNAGTMVNQRETTDDKLEKNFATNTLGTYILSTELIPALEKSKCRPRIVTVSSGGMLVMKLDSNDLQFEQVRNFDGTFAYAQNKRQQVVMVRRWALQYPNISFSSMHPGWADTPAVQNSMPDFHRRMQDKLRTPEQGADTIVWLCLSEKALKCPNGSFFQDRVVVSEHLPLAHTRSSDADELQLISRLEEMTKTFKNQL
ncbi:dehydrogenase/reductase SDR family member 12-like [Dysidea avara]|uniref:dehydrogenase/reductase SDR family member 12-like n=1 Tax=Dysidea avara TaxID=196820 RepID=UPI00332B741B